MRKFGMVPCNFWQDPGIGDQDTDCKLLALYLLTNRHSNIIYLYYLPIAYIVADTGLTTEVVQQHITHLQTIGFCKYEHASNYIWLPEPMRFSLGDALKPGDNRIEAIRKIVSTLSRVELVDQFVKEFGDAYGLNNKPAPVGACKFPSKQGEGKGEGETTRIKSNKQTTKKRRVKSNLEPRGGVA